MTPTRSIAPTERHTAPRRAGAASSKTAASAPRSRRTARPRRAGIGIRIGGRQVSISTLLLVDVVLLCVIGLVMVGSASTVISIATYGTPWAIFIREVMWMAIGAVVLWLAVRFDYRKLRRVSPLLLLVTFGLLLVVLVPGLGVHARARAAGSASGSSASSPRS